MKQNWTDQSVSELGLQEVGTDCFRFVTAMSMRHRGRAVLWSSRQKGVQNSIPAAPDTYHGRAFKQIAANRTRTSRLPRKSHGPMLSKAVVALLPFTSVLKSVRTLLGSKIPPPSPITLPFALL